MVWTINWQQKTAQYERLEKIFKRATFTGQLQLGEVVALARDLDRDYFGDRFSDATDDGFFNEVDITVKVFAVIAEELAGVEAFADSLVLRDAV